MTSSDHTGLTRDLAPFGLRIPIELKDRIKRAAAESNRSINAEIIYALELAYPAPSSVSELQQKLDRVVQRWERASSDAERRDLVDHLTEIRRQLSTAVENAAKARAEEIAERERARNKPFTEDDIPF